MAGDVAIGRDTTQPAYRAPSTPVHERVADLLGRMTREEKLAQLVGVWVAADPGTGRVAPYQGRFLRAALSPDELDAQLRVGVGHLTRPLGSGPVDPATGAQAVNEVQRQLV